MVPRTGPGTGPRRRGSAPLRRDRHARHGSARGRRRPDDGVPGRPARTGDGGGRAGGARPVRDGADPQPVARAAAGRGRGAAGGLVDPRVVLVLADLASPRRLAVDDFPVEPLEPPYALRRHVLLSAVDGLPASAARSSRCARGSRPAEPVRPELDRGSGRGPAHRISGSHPDGTDRRLTHGGHDAHHPPCRRRGTARPGGSGRRTATPAVALAAPADTPRPTSGSHTCPRTRPPSTCTSTPRPTRRGRSSCPGWATGWCRSTSRWRPTAT
jgi:hypothetical protein